MDELSIKVVEELNPTERIELATFSNTSYYPLIRKIMETLIVEQRDAAMAVDPANRDEQVARMTEAHAMGLLYTRFCKLTEQVVTEYRGEKQAEVARHALDDPAFIEKIVLGQN